MFVFNNLFAVVCGAEIILSTYYERRRRVVLLLATRTVLACTKWYQSLVGGTLLFVVACW